MSGKKIVLEKNRPGLVNDVIFYAKLCRLENIHQLQFLSTLRLNGQAIRGLYPHTFGHNRLSHSILVAALASSMAKRCGLEESDINKLIVAGLLHDAFTCAGGDSWKDINQQGTLFDEDNDFANKIFRYFGDGWKTLCARYGWNPEQMAKEVAEIVAGHGLLGGIQEIADTASYMLGDLEQIEQATRRRRNSRDFAQVLSASRHGWHIWNCVTVVDGKIAVTDPIALNNFLMLRILLWASLYNHPRHKFLECLMQRIVYPYLVDKRAIKISELPIRDDKWLDRVIGRQMGWSVEQTRCLDLLGGFPKLKAFADMDEALAFEEEKFRSCAATLIYDVREFQLTKSKVEKYHVIGENGSSQTFALPFAHAYPTRAEAIEEIARLAMAPDKPVQVAWVEKPMMFDNYRRAWLSARARWHKGE